MKFELTYANGSKITVDLPDRELVRILDEKAKGIATAATVKAEKDRGDALSAVLKV